ncbi:adenylyltransferase and sulfurtransferase uba4 [Colletotrichum spaethianum]|uniref:Adenylyltransferase and sulfurtransferase uba4 n=1 Tax=Colletotrichum spaethianum TaxID=700344 RepID=A0AA37P480_9PEZI|nr:adenylyltransferase and sulfurtransferase uba4 [Colletotrichum spaethianum]GKT40491.1 adenylyltransferase and sulfurtransferase uba4 [Colletotrichum spaethianum]
MGKIEDLRRRVAETTLELQHLNQELEQAEREAQEAQNAPAQPWKWPLQPEDYERYGRQLIIPNVGITGQLRLKESKILIVGAGDWDAPQRLTSLEQGLAPLGLSMAMVGVPKVESAITYLKGLNPLVAYRAHNEHLTPLNAEDIVSQYDIVLDCTDHPTSRYLISDICVLLQKPLVSASAFRTDGQLIILNSPAAPQGGLEGGPCYRCVFPKPPPPDSVVSCGEGGILGPVVGVMGVLQALEAIKLVASGAVDPKVKEKEAAAPSLLIFSGAAPSGPFRSVRMRGRRKDCFACSPTSTLSLETLRSGSLDYISFCGVSAPVSVLGPDERISAAQYERTTKENGGCHLLLDVRERENFDICSIEGAINIPIAKFMKETQPSSDGTRPRPEWLPANFPDDAPIYLVCRVGNDSQIATKRLKDLDLDNNGKRFIGDIEGGMKAWKHQVDPTLPFT